MSIKRRTLTLDCSHCGKKQTISMEVLIYNRPTFSSSVSDSTEVVDIEECPCGEAITDETITEVLKDFQYDEDR